MKTKKDILYSYNHTRERLEERYGIFIEFKDYTEMCERIIKKKDVKFISEEKQKNDIQRIYDMSFKCLICPTKVIRVVWSKTNRYIKTVLPIKEN